MLKLPDIERRIRRIRLNYLFRLLKHGPHSLSALLCFSVEANGTDGGLKRRLPWVQQLILGLEALKGVHGEKLAELPPPCDDAEPWFGLQDVLHLVEGTPIRVCRSGLGSGPLHLEQGTLEEFHTP